MPHGLTYFVELEAAPLARLLTDPVVDLLHRSRASVALAMLDLSPERAEVVRHLRGRGIAVTAWLVLEPHQGYWLTADNAGRAAERYREVRDWARAHGLDLQAIGLDIEIPHADAVALTQRPVHALGRLLRARRPTLQVQAARRAYGELVEEIRQGGYRAETYQFPLVHEDRAAGSRLLQRSLGLVDVPADREVLMLYRSVLPRPWGALLVDAYGRDADAIAVGITGGGVASLQPAFANRLLDWEGLVTDLRRARRYTQHLYVFSLEGCVEAGLLEPLVEADLHAHARPHHLGPVATLGRAALRTALRAEPAWHRLRGRH